MGSRRRILLSLPRTLSGAQQRTRGSVDGSVKNKITFIPTEVKYIWASRAPLLKKSEGCIGDDFKGARPGHNTGYVCVPPFCVSCNWTAWQLYMHTYTCLSLFPAAQVERGMRCWCCTLTRSPYCLCLISSRGVIYYTFITWVPLDSIKSTPGVRQRHI